MKKQVLILGAGGLGREVFHWAHDCGYEVLGLIDDNQNALEGYKGYAHILGGVDDIPLMAPIICGVGKSAVRRACVERLLVRGAEFVSCVHPLAKVLDGSTFGRGAVIAPFAYVGADVNVGDFLFMQTGAVLGHDVAAGDFLRMDTTAFVGGFSQIGNDVTLYTGAKVMPGKTVGDHCTLGAGSVLLNNLYAGATAFGVPAQKI
ncbi:MAG: hypothetical protein RSD41_02030 [Kiritimatiellia bacterium]